VQDALVEALRTWPEEPPRDPKGWLVTVAWRLFLDEQDRELWDTDLISEGVDVLQAALGTAVDGGGGGCKRRVSRRDDSRRKL
jgi:predicted RNA polymerase sigma factor